MPAPVHHQAAMLRTLWSYRRWGYAVWLLSSLTRIPARTGNCRLTDVLPDLAGALVALALVAALLGARRSTAS